MGVLEKQRISVRDGKAGRLLVEGHVAEGLGIIRCDERGGCVLVHAASGYFLTPVGWRFAQFDDAARCVRLLVDQYGDMFEGDVRSIQMMGTQVLDAHRQAGAHTGKTDYLRRLNAVLEAGVFDKRLAALREQGAPVLDVRLEAAE